LSKKIDDIMLEDAILAFNEMFLMEITSEFYENDLGKP